jgi:hypothetical protein
MRPTLCAVKCGANVPTDGLIPDFADAQSGLRPHGAVFDAGGVPPFALAIADGLLKTGLSKRALVIGSETFSRIPRLDRRSAETIYGS